jgi:hypothetical protein
MFLIFAQTRRFDLSQTNMEANREYDNYRSTERAENRHEFPGFPGLGHRAERAMVLVLRLPCCGVLPRLAETQLILYYGAK